MGAMRGGLWTGVLCGALVGCAASGGPRPGSVIEDPVRTDGSFVMEVPLNRNAHAYATALSAPPERVWAELPAVYEQLGIPLDQADRSDRVLGTHNRLLRRIEGERLSAWVDCGEGPMGASKADRYEVRLSISSRVVPFERGSSIESSVAGSAVDRAVSGGAVPCFSLGTLEARIAALLQLRLMGVGGGAQG